MLNYNGLNDEEVKEQRKLHGSNELAKIKSKSFFKIMLSTLGDPIIKILLIALAIKLLFMFSKYDFFESIGIAIAVFLASFISTICEYGSEEAFKKLEEQVSNIKVKVKRNKTLKEISINDVVVNDIVYLESGDMIPADGILIKGSLKVNESPLTGEAKEISKTLLKNLLYRGCIITSGSGEMLVTKVGNETEVGKISLEIQKEDPESPLKIRLYGLAKIISKIGYIGALIVSLSYLFDKIVIQNNFNLNEIINTITNLKLLTNYIIYALTLSVTIIIVAVPEGLPMMITLVLSSNTKRMLKDNVLVRKPTGIETSGNLTYLLTDKTGTLTKGILEVTGVYLKDGSIYKNEGDLYKAKVYDILIESIILNNESIKTSNGIIGGNSTDRALLNFINKDIDRKKIIRRIPFSSDNKYSIIYLKDYYLIKGASEVILPKCKYYLDKNNLEHIIFNTKYIEDLIDRHTKEGKRVIILAKGNTNNDYLTFIGFVTLKDEIREHAKDGIDIINKAGINTIMITGDSKKTAEVIAKECNIISSSRDLIIDSESLNKAKDDDIKKIIKDIKVIARAKPTDKSRLVRILQELGEVVGMTGDGVNDAPALKSANVGFAMGSGTDISKEASDIIILDNNILSISKAILYGRTAFKSIRKFVTYQLTVNFTALFLSIIGTYIGISNPITIIQMLWLNMIMDTFAGLAFSYEYPLSYYMNELPKKQDEPILNRYMYNGIIVMGLYSSILCILFLKLPIFKSIIPNDKTFITAYFALFIFLGIFNAFNFRTERKNILSNIYKNKVFIFIYIFIITIQLYIIYNGKDLFRTYGMPIDTLMFVILLSLSVIVVDFIRKIILKKKKINISY